GVAVCDHAAQTIVLADWQGTDVLVGHHLSGFTNAPVRIGQADIACHRFADFHGEPPLTQLKRRPADMAATAWFAVGLPAWAASRVPTGTLHDMAGHPCCCAAGLTSLQPMKQSKG